MSLTPSLKKFILESLEHPTETAFSQIHSFTVKMLTASSLAKFHGVKTFEGKPIPTFSDDDISLGTFINSWDTLFSHQIPFDLWSEIAKKGLTLMEELIKSGDFAYEKNSRYGDFIKQFQDCCTKIRTMPEYSARFLEMGR